MSFSINVHNLKKSFYDTPVISGVSLKIDQGKLVCIIGKSGCGKSTLLRCLNGLEVLDSGFIQIGDISLERKVGEPFNQKKFEFSTQKLREIVGMVFQQFHLFNHLTLLENITLAPTVVKKIPQEEAKKIAREMLSLVGLSSLENKYPIQLSGGQQQRAAIARTLCLQPKVILYDEPTSALDPELVDEVLQVMKKLDQEFQITQLVVTHEMRFAKEAADNVIFMGEGNIVEEGSAQDIFTNPQHELTKHFLKKYL